MPVFNPQRGACPRAASLWRWALAMGLLLSACSAPQAQIATSVAATLAAVTPATPAASPSSPPAAPSATPPAPGLPEVMVLPAVDGRFAALSLSKSGEALAALTEVDPAGRITRVTGALWFSSAGASVYLKLSPDGVPALAVANGYIAAFSNYSAAAVDAAVTAPDGRLAQEQGVAVPAPKLAWLKQAAPAAVQTGGSPAEALALAARALGVFGCPAANGALGPVFGVECASPLLAFWNAQPESGQAVAEGAALNSADFTCPLGAVAPGPGAPQACASLAARVVAQLTAAAEVAQQAQAGPTSAAPTPTPTPSPRVTLAPTPGGAACHALQNVNVRAGPGTAYGIVAILTNADTVTPIGRTADSVWLEVRTSQGKTGWLAVAMATCTLAVAEIAIEPNIPPPPPTPTVTPSPTPLPTATSAGPTISFVADRTTLNPGECATVTWAVGGVKEVYFNGQGVTGFEHRKVCPTATTTYKLEVVLLTGAQETHTLTIAVSVTATPAPSATISFVANPTALNPGECATLVWEVSGAKEIYYNGAAVANKENRLVCPAATTTYTLDVVDSGGSVRRGRSRSPSMQRRPRLLETGAAQSETIGHVRKDAQSKTSN